MFFGTCSEVSGAFQRGAIVRVVASAEIRHRGGVKAASAAAGPSRWARQAGALLAQILDDALRDDLRLRFEERAAICEIDGELPRADAERVAFESLVKAIERLRAR
jgi:hypothetical protein